MASDDNRVCPAGDQAWHVLNDDGFAENHAAQNVADRAIGRLPHFLKAEFFNARFVRRDCRAFDAHTKFANGVCGFDCHLVIGLVPIFHAEVVIFQVNIEIGQNEPLTYPLPNDASHFVAIEFNDRVFDLNFCHGRKHFR